MILFFLLLQAPEPKTTTPTPVISEKIEAKVGTEIITSSDVTAMMKAFASSARGETEKVARKRALDSLIERALVRTYLTKAGSPITDQEIDQRINSIKAANNISSNDDFKTMLSAQGISFDQFKDQIRFQLEQMNFINFMRRQAQRTIEDKDLKDFYQKNKSSYSKNYEVDLQECVLPLGSDAQAVEALAENYKKKPDTFDQCVTKHSQSPSAASKGNIGKFQSGILREDVEKQVFALEKGQVALVHQQGSIQLLRVKAKSALGTQTYEAVRDRIREKLEGDIIQREIEKTMADLRATTFIQI